MAGPSSTTTHNRDDPSSDSSEEVELEWYLKSAGVERDVSKSKKYCCGYCSRTRMLVFVGILLVIIAGSAIYFSDGISYIMDSDPFGGNVSLEDPEEAYRWHTSQSGLELKLLNALDESWQLEFANAVSEWDNGSPDSLTLSVRQVDYEKDCEPVTGLLKVCNGDYGETEWRGLNAVVLDNNRKWIFSSEAKLNEFYLKDASNAQRRFTMCHELGHGFGLPHWDEQVFNLNMGNCMDYTNRPASNAQPDESNFIFLEKLYGEVGGTMPPEEPGTTYGLPATPPLGWSGGDGRQRQRLRRQRQLEQQGSESTTTEELPDDVLSEFGQAILEFDLPNHGDVWQLAENVGETETYERVLGGGAFVARLAMLKA